MTIRYTVNNNKFRILTIKYNGTRNRLEVSPTIVNSDAVKDPRFMKARLQQNGNMVHVDITLRRVSFADNGLSFFYEYKDKQLVTWQCTHRLTISWSYEDTDVTGIVLGVILFVGLCVVVFVFVVLWRKGVIKEMCGGGRGSSGGGGRGDMEEDDLDDVFVRAEVKM